MLLRDNVDAYRPTVRGYQCVGLYSAGCTGMCARLASNVHVVAAEMLELCELNNSLLNLKSSQLNVLCSS